MADAPKEITSLQDIMDEVNAPLNQNEKTEAVETTQTTEQSEQATEEENEQTQEKNEEVQYNPDFTFKVKDQVFNFDERFKTIIKTKEDEDFIRDLHTRSHGLDSYKEKVSKHEQSLAEMSTALEEREAKLSETQEFFNELVESRNSKKFRKLAKKLGMTDDDVLNFAVEIAEERELPSDQQRQRQQERENAFSAELQAREKQKQNGILEQRLNYLTQKTVDIETRDRVNREASDLQNKINTQYKDLNESMSALGLNLFDEVVVTGRSLVHRGHDGSLLEPKIEDAIAATVKKYEKLSGIKKSDEKTSQTKVITREKKETINGVKGSNSNVVDKPISTLDDIKKEFDALTRKTY